MTRLVFFLSVVCVYIHERSIWRDDNYIVGFADGVINYSWVWLYFLYIMYWKTNYWSLFMSITHFVRNSNYGLSHQCHIHVCIECAVVASHLWPVTHAHTCTPTLSSVCMTHSHLQRCCWVGSGGLLRVSELFHCRRVAAAAAVAVTQ